MKKLIIIIIGIIALLMISFALVHKTSSAAVATVSKPCGDNKICKECKLDELIKKDGYFQLKTDSLKAGTAQEKFEKNLKESTNNNNGYLNDLTVRIAFEEARTQYHDAMKCVFDFSTIAILGSAGGVTDDISLANLPNLVDLLPKLIQPNMACLKQDVLKATLEKTSPTELLKPVLATYSKYEDFLNYLHGKASSNPTVKASDRQNLAKIVSNYKALQLVMENEIQDAIVALDTAFIALKEMRQAFVLHVNFQCMLKNLEVYRRVMANLRSVIAVLPPLVTDASMHK